MNQYVTGAVIKALREKNKMTQLQLGEPARQPDHRQRRCKSEA